MLSFSLRDVYSHSVGTTPGHGSHASHGTGVYEGSPFYPLGAIVSACEQVNIRPAYPRAMYVA